MGNTALDLYAFEQQTPKFANMAFRLSTPVFLFFFASAITIIIAAPFETAHSLQQDAKTVSLSAYPGYGGTVSWPIYSEKTTTVMLGVEGPGYELVSFESESVILVGDQTTHVHVMVSVPADYHASGFPVKLEPIITATQIADDKNNPQPIQIQLAKKIHIIIEDDLSISNIPDKTDSSQFENDYDDDYDDDGYSIILSKGQSSLDPYSNGDFFPYVYVILAISAVCAVLLAVLVMRHKKSPGSRNAF